MTSISLPAPAKLNLFLHINGRRSDGYHQLQTLFQLLDYGDTLHFSPNHSGQITVDMPALSLPPEQNLVVKAARLLQQGDQGVHITIDKRLPDGGGLGGGSSNAATTLLALNKLWDCNHSIHTLANIGITLGADVPVFVHGNTAWAEGVGEKLSPVKLPKHWYIVVKPDCSVSTGEIFSHSRLTRDSSAITMAAFFDGAHRNDCQGLVRTIYPRIDNALKWLDNFADARLTGTGACIFAQCQDQSSAQAILREVPPGWSAFIARGINRSPVHQSLAI